MRILSIPAESLIAPCGIAFNPAIVVFRGKTLLLYRYDTIPGEESALALCELGPDLMPLPATNRKMEVVRVRKEISSIEDPRTVVIGDRLIVVHTQCCRFRCPPYRPIWSSSVCIVHFPVIWFANKTCVPEFGLNLNEAARPGCTLIAREKNWVPFERLGKLRLVYSLNPLVVIQYDLKWKQIRPVSKSEFDQSFWKYGDYLSGSTPLIRRGDEYVGFFHSWTVEPFNATRRRRYHIGYIAISAEEPHRVTRISTQPLVSAEADDAGDLRPPNAPWRPNVVFPGGWIGRDGQAVLSVGWQDCRCKLYVFEWSEILESTSSPTALSPSVRPASCR